MSSTFRNLVVWVILGSVLIYVFNNLNSSSSRDQISYSEFQREVFSDNVQRLTYKGDQQTIIGTRLDGTTFETIQSLYKFDFFWCDDSICNTCSNFICSASPKI